METKFRIVETEEYTLAVSDGEIKKDDYFYYTWFNADIIQKADSGSNLNNLNAKNPKDNFKKIIAYQPKGNAPELDLPLLPEFEPRGFDEFEYTEDDLRKAIAMAKIAKTDDGLIDMDAWISNGYEGATPAYNENEIIQSLKQPKWFVAEIEVNCTGNNNDGCFMDSCGHDCGCLSLKTTTINNKIHLVGTYLN
jgi:hypothetical protein